MIAMLPPIIAEFLIFSGAERNFLIHFSTYTIIILALLYIQYKKQNQRISTDP